MNRDETLSNKSFYAAQKSASQVWRCQGNCRISLGILGAKQHSADAAAELCKSTLHLIRAYRQILLEFCLHSDLHHLTEFVWVCIWIGYGSGWFHAEMWTVEVDFDWLLWEYAFSALQAHSSHHSVFFILITQLFTFDFSLKC